MRRLQFARTLARRFRGPLLTFLLLASATWTVTGTPRQAAGASTNGYWLVGTDGGIFAYGRAAFLGSTGEIPLNQPIVGMAPTPSGRGYWLVASDGGIFGFGDAAFLGSMGGESLNKPVVAMAATRTGRGYWLVSSDGGIFAFGDAVFLGSAGDEKLGKPTVDIAVTPSGGGYWLVTSDGRVFAYGDAAHHGSVETGLLAKRIHAMAATPTGRGYWLVAGDGGVFAYGDGGFFGSAGATAEKRVIDIASSASGQGYYVTTSNGQVISLGDAAHHGGADDTRLNHRIAAMAVVSGNEPPVAADDAVSVDEDGEVTIDVLANDTDPEDGPLVLQSVGLAEHGTATPAGGKITYRPVPDYHGDDLITYVVADDAGGVATGRVAVTVKSVNDVPKPVDDAVAASENASIVVPILDNDAGLGDGVKEVVIKKGPSNGDAEINADNTLTYVPEASFSGTDSVRYRVVDADGEAGEAVVTLSVADENDIPVAVDDGPYELRGGETFTARVLDNDDPGDGWPQIRLVNPDEGLPTKDGKITTEGGSFKRHDGTIVYTPAAGFQGMTEIQYVVVDEDGEGETSNPATVTFEVLNGAPRALGQNLTVEQGKTATGTLKAEDPEGDPLSFRVVDGSGPAPVRLLLNDRTGEFSFGPVNEPGTYTFKFVANDGVRDSNAATVTVDAKRVGQEPGASQPASTTTTAAFLAPLALLGFRRRRR